MPTLLIFHASNTKFDGKYNWIEYQELKTQPNQKLLVKILDGPFEEIPNYRQPNPFIAFKRKECTDLGADNFLAGGSLAKIGFFGQKDGLYECYVGSVVCIINKKIDKDLIEIAISMRQKEMEHTLFIVCVFAMVLVFFFFFVFRSKYLFV
jgi:hypothetical protein